MNNTKVGHFPPPKQLGLVLHSFIILMLATVSAFGVWDLNRAQVGPSFVTSLLAALLSVALIPFFGYRAYALLRADYYIDRDSLAMLWGLRLEDVPLTDIEWVRPASDLTHPLALPGFQLAPRGSWLPLHLIRLQICLPYPFYLLGVRMVSRPHCGVTADLL